MSLDAVEAKEEGWMDKAEESTSRDDVVKFILMHGGECCLTSQQGTDFNVGGRLKDPTIDSYKNALRDVVK